MARSVVPVPGWPVQGGVVRRDAGSRWWGVLVAVELACALPMLAMMGVLGLMIGVWGLAEGEAAGAVLGFELELVAGPLLGLALPALLLLVPAVRPGARGARAALLCGGLLVGTAIEYAWMHSPMN
ncbi:hypothetical protein [Kitasatospora sp. LaBMicrA B282]|uniref:hypothetical protein n=1 Tax=Kitasatospora sp. LaBMicrA B282 TaxID=3420949 RepID=UPI003D10007F